MDNRTQHYAEKLSAMIQKETISCFHMTDLTKFYEFRDLLRNLFPKVFATCECEDYNGSFLLKWKGLGEGEPIMLMNHHDVVEAPGQWTHPPFSGEIADGKLWGRGTLDTKGGLMCMLQAAEELIEEGYIPARDIYFESSCNEEVEGFGAEAIAKELERRGIHFYMTLDEGGEIMYDPIGGADGTFAVTGIAEKGCVDLKFIARSNGGHASMPGRDTPLVRLGKFMADVGKFRIFTVKMNDTTMETFRRFSEDMKGVKGFLLKHPRFFRHFLEKGLPYISTAANAMMRTTIAFTMAGGSDSTNVLPQEAWVIGNMRVAHQQGFKGSIQAVSDLAKKRNIEVEILDPGYESRISDFRSDAFKLVEGAVHKVFPGVKVAPYIMNGASDSRFMDRVCDNCIRLAPFVIDDQQLNSIHGLDENVDLACLAPAVDFYKYIIREGNYE